MGSQTLAPGRLDPGLTRKLITTLEGVEVKPATPPGSSLVNAESGGVAVLNHRLMSGIPPGCKMPSRSQEKPTPKTYTDEPVSPLYGGKESGFAALNSSQSLLQIQAW